MKKALLVAINQYADTNNNLSGCVNDVVDMWDTLVQCYDFLPSNINVITDHRATYSNITTNLEKLLINSKDGETIIFYYSGHGSQVIDLNFDEEDGLDEIICPHDFDWNRPLSDDVFADILNKNLKPNCNFWMVMDCCHSGTMNRELEIITSGEVRIEKTLYDPMYEKKRYIQAPVEVFLKYPDYTTRSISTQKTTTQNHILLAASASYQTAAEKYIGGKPRGVFTYNLCNILRGNKDILLKDFSIKINAAVHQQSEQHTQSEYEIFMADKPIFS